MSAAHIAALEAALHTEAMNLPLEVLFGVLAEVKRLRAENEALKRDAERYRFIRDADRSDCITPEIGLYAMESLDGYVDAAMEDEARIMAAQAAKERTS